MTPRHDPGAARRLPSRPPFPTALALALALAGAARAGGDLPGGVVTPYATGPLERASRIDRDLLVRLAKVQPSPINTSVTTSVGDLIRGLAAIQLCRYLDEKASEPYRGWIAKGAERCLRDDYGFREGPGAKWSVREAADH